ncbi:MAG: hypothetical protein KTR32_11615 [Granulosicoccus sp.]|nr:hypothetical protein [Granulosicoccus sp.]
MCNLCQDLAPAIPLIGLLSGSFGATGVLAGQALANSLAGIAAYLFAFWLVKRVKNGLPIYVRWIRCSLLHYREIAPGVQHRGH